MATELTFFDMYRTYLKIGRSDSSDLPKETEEIYSLELGKILNVSKWENPKFNGTEDRQLLTYQLSKDFKVTVKRKGIYCNISDPDLEEEEKKILKNHNIQLFLNEGLKEYFMSRIISAHPAGVLSYDFRITRLPKINHIVYEFIMENAGVTLTDFLMYKKPSNFNGLKYFVEMINIMKFIEKLHLAYSDVKALNFLVDGEGHLRIIDYDISQKAGFGETNTVQGVTRMLGSTPGYVAPETIIFIEKQISNTLKKGEKIDPWKADAYSCGILGLIMFGAIKDPTILKNLDSHKKTESSNQKIIALAEDIECSPVIKEKLQHLLSVCLDYDPNKRLNFAQLSKILENINEKLDLDQFKKKIIEMLKERHEKREELYEKIENLQKENMDKERNLQNSQKINNNLRLENDALRNQINKMAKQIQEQGNEIGRKSKEINEIQSELSEHLISVQDVQEKFGLMKSMSIKEISKFITQILSKQNLKNNNNFVQNNNPNIIQENINTSQIQKPINTQNIGITGSPLKIIPREKLRTEIQKVLEKKNFWSLYNMNLTSDEIISICKLGVAQIELNGIDFYKNEFNEVTGKAYYDFASKNSSITGIVIAGLNISKKMKMEIIRLMKFKVNIKFAVVERTGIDEGNEEILKNELGLELNNWNSKYSYDYYHYYGNNIKTTTTTKI